MFLIVYYLIVSALAAKCSTTQANCDGDNCEMVGTTEVCTQCVAGNVPIDGTCTKVGDAKEKCKKNENTPVGDTDTKCGQCLNSYFMFKGGCYQTTQQPGQTMCAEASTGKCTRAADGKTYFVPPSDTDATHDSVVSCGDATNGVTLGGKKYVGVNGCAKCDAPGAGAGSEKVATCTKCKDGFFGKNLGADGATCAACHDQTNCATCSDGEANHCTKCKTDKYLTATGTCVETCTEGTQFSTETPESGKKCFDCNDSNNGVDGCERCIAPGASQPKPTCTKCKAEKYLKIDGTCANDATGCTAKTEFGKKDSVNGNKCVKCNNVAAGGITDCAECAAIESPAKAGAPLVTCSQCNGKKVQPDKKGCVDTCPANSSDKSGVCECVEGYAPSADGSSCASSSTNKSALSTGAIAGISVAAVVVVGGLVGFLCWWFVCRGKA